MSDVTEHEAISRFIEGIKEASSSIRLLEDFEKNRDETTKFAKALRVASGSAWQLYHMQDNPDFLAIRDQLEILMKQGSIMAVNKHLGFNIKAKYGVSPFVALSNMLLAISEIGARLATSKAVPRNVVLGALDERQKNLQKTVH